MSMSALAQDSACTIFLWPPAIQRLRPPALSSARCTQHIVFGHRLFCELATGCIFSCVCAFACGWRVMTVWNSQLCTGRSRCCAAVTFHPPALIFMHCVGQVVNKFIWKTFLGQDCLDKMVIKQILCSLELKVTITAYGQNVQSKQK